MEKRKKKYSLIYLFVMYCIDPLHFQRLNLPQELATELLLHGIKKRVVSLQNLAVMLTSNWIQKLEGMLFGCVVIT